MSAEEKPVESNDPSPKRRRKTKRWIVFAVLVGGLIWLNGPGLRWLAPKVAGHFLPKAGLRGSFELEGSLTGGISVNGLRLESEKTLALLTVGRVTPSYRFAGLAKGQLDGITIDGLHADVRLGLASDKPEEAEEEKAPLDLEGLVKIIRSVRSRVLQVGVDLKDISLNATQDGKPVISLAKTRIHHEAGAPDVDLEIGVITDATGREWPARNSKLTWTENELEIDRLDPLPGLGLRNLSVRLPESGGPSAELELHVDDAVFQVNASPGFSAVQVHLREGRLVGGTVAGHFDVKLPVGVELTSLTANVENLLPDPTAATGAVQVLLENVVYEDWKVRELSLDAVLESGRGTIATRGFSLGTEFSVKAEAPISREGGGFKPGDVSGNLNIADVPKLLADLSKRFEVIDPEAPVPQSVLDGDFHVVLTEGGVKSAEAGLVLKPADSKVATTLSVKGKWQPEQPVSAEVMVDGLTIKALYHIDKPAYEGTLEAEEFTSARIDPWLAITKFSTDGAVSLTGKWAGSGDIKAGTHDGNLSLAGLNLLRKEVPPIFVTGGVDYQWPSGLTTKDLKVQAEKQAVSADVKLADGFVELSGLQWQDDKTYMISGEAKLPVPEDFSKWKEMLADDKRPVSVSIESETLSLALLKEWLPAAEKLDPDSTGKVNIQVSGTYPNPSINVLVEAKNLRSPEQPDLPPADLKLMIVGKDGHLSVDGSVITPDFKPAVMTASMPFRPAEWAENPGLVMEEKVSARVDLPKVDLSRFGSMVPGSRKVSGMVSGNIEVAGEIGKPDVKGRIDLTGGGLELKSKSVPPVSGLVASVDLALDRITLKTLKATIAGGTLDAGGSLEIKDGKPGAIDFRLRGDHLPLKRDASLIVRASTNLRLSGAWEKAALTGTVDVVNSIFFKDIELLPIGSPFTTPSAESLPRLDPPTTKPAESVPEPFRNWTIDVRVRTGNPFLVRGNLATGQAVVNMKIGGTIGSPAPDGEVTIKDFRASLPFSTLNVRSGILRFTPEGGFDPALEIRGSAEPRPYRVNVFVYGKASDPQLVLTSSPPLPENEIMTLLATGTTTSGLADPQQASSRALQLFAEELRRGRFAVGKQLRPVLKLLDRVDFTMGEADPYSSQSFSTATLQLTDRWYLSAGMGAEGDSRILGIWRLRFY